MIDSHAHLNFKAFKADYTEVVQRSLVQGIEAIINVGSNLATSQRAVEIAKEFTECRAAVGLHPIHVKDEEFVSEKYVFLIKENKEVIKAIGETGLDYYHSSENKKEQKKVFLKHIDLAKQFDLPVIMHCRGSRENSKDAYLDLLSIIKQLSSVPPGEIHCFSADWPIAEQFLSLGFFVGFTGPITFGNATPELLEVVKNMPLNKILVETDCPFLAPEPHRGERNEPSYVRFTAEKIAELKGLSFDEVDKAITKNAKKLFKL